MSHKEIELAIFDLEGVLSKGKIFAKNVDYPEKILNGERENLDYFNKFMHKRSIPKVAVTGRSLIITKPIIEYCMDNISACEHGCMIYNPKTNQEYHLIDDEIKFKRMIKAKNSLERFIENSKKYDNLITQTFPEANIVRLTDNLHIITYEIFTKQGEKHPKGEIFSKNIYKLLYGQIFDEEIKNYLSTGSLIPLFSQGALDIKPNISKADGLQHIISKLRVDTKNILVGGDSFHSDLEMMEVIENGYWFCPGNSDDRLKKEVSNRGVKGYIAEKDYFEGAIEALHHFLD